MEGFVFGAVRPPPECCDDRGKRPKQESESEAEEELQKEPEQELQKEPEQESQKEPEVELQKEPAEESPKEPEEESEEESEYEEYWDWESKTLEDMKQRYDNDPKPRYFACRNFEYENEASKTYRKETQKAVIDYIDVCRGMSPFDPIPIPPLAQLPGTNFARELVITDSRRERYTDLSHCALASYNTKNQLANDKEYEFAELVKVVTKRIPLGTSYITFNAKPKDATSNCSATTFQAHVVKNFKGTDIKYCSIKT